MAPTRSRPSSNGRLRMPIDWSEVLTRHDRWLRTVVWARVREFRAVDDVMQEVALAAVAQRAPLADPTKLAPWLYRLAVTQALLYRRSQGRQRKLADRYAQQLRSGAPDALAGDPLAWMLAVERRQLVRAALERLPRRDAEILLLKYIEEWSYQELAAHLGISQSAIEARLHRARQRLRTALADRHEIEVSP